MSSSAVLISIIIPIFNGAKWIQPCFEAILQQTAIKMLNLEICVCNDASTDETSALLKKWKIIFEAFGIPLKLFNNISCTPGGVGYSRNKAVNISSGTYLCFQDIDDVMLPDRILLQHKKACCCLIIGSQFVRRPINSTTRYTKWANSLTEEQLNLQVYTSHGPTIIMPTWFCHRQVFNRVGGFAESSTGTPEDLIFFNKHLDLGGNVSRVNEVLLIYSFHSEQVTFSIHKTIPPQDDVRNIFSNARVEKSVDTIWYLRVERLERVVLSNWSNFTIWNAGKQGRKLYNSLSGESREKVVALCDVDKNKIGQKYVPYDPIERKSGTIVDIVDFRDALPPFVICMKMDLTEGVFENNLKQLNLKEGNDYVIFN